MGRHRGSGGYGSTRPAGDDLSHCIGHEAHRVRRRAAAVAGRPIRLGAAGAGAHPRVRKRPEGRRSPDPPLYAHVGTVRPDSEEHGAAAQSSSHRGVRGGRVPDGPALRTGHTGELPEHGHSCDRRDRGACYRRSLAGPLSPAHGFELLGPRRPGTVTPWAGSAPASAARMR
jgi:hypothetical protein